MKIKKKCVAMLLAGGQGSRLYALTQKVAKPAIPYGGKYRIIDFPLSNCTNSGVDTVSSPIEEQSIVIFPPTLMELYSAIFPLMPPEFISNVRSCASVMELPKVNDIFAPFLQVIDREFKFKSVPLTAITVTPETIPL